jgi:hypothetical protein
MVIFAGEMDIAEAPWAFKAKAKEKEINNAIPKEMLLFILYRCLKAKLPSHRAL